MPCGGDLRAASERRVPVSRKKAEQPAQGGKVQRTTAICVFAVAALVSSASAVDTNTATEARQTVLRSRSTAESRAVVRYDAYYDRSGKRIEPGVADEVGPDSLYFKRYNRNDTLYGCPKSQVPDPTPAGCRTGFAFIDGQNRVCVDPAGMYIYEVDITSLRRHDTEDGSYTDFTIPNGRTCCTTDGAYLYVPVGDTVYKYTLTGALVSKTTINITPLEWRFSVAKDTVWCSSGSRLLRGYACSRFTGGGPISPDTTWDVGDGIGSGVQLGWDGQYYYAAWSGGSDCTFKRFNPDRSLSAAGLISIDVRGVLCTENYPISVDSLYFKALSGTNLMCAAKSVYPVPSDLVPMSFQGGQNVPCMDPQGRYVYEVNGTNLRRFSAAIGTYTDFTLPLTGGIVCATDGNYLFVPTGPAVHKYTMTGDYVNTTVLNITCDSFSFALANDTVWASPDRDSHVFYGYASTRFEGDSVSEDQVWDVGPGTHGTGNIAWDGTYYYVTWIGTHPTTFKRFGADRALFDSGEVSIDPRSVMCLWTSHVAVAEPAAVLPSSASLLVAPNPVRSGLAFLRYGLPGSSPATITVYDVAGRPVRRSVLAGAREGAVRLDLRELSDGVYLVRLEAGTHAAAQKLVLRR
jgi:hypothetical protein